MAQWSAVTTWIKTFEEWAKLRAVTRNRNGSEVEGGVMMVVTHSCKLKNLGGQIFEYGCDIDGSLGTYAHLVLGVLLQETLDTSARELSGEISTLVKPFDI